MLICFLDSINVSPVLFGLITILSPVAVIKNCVKMHSRIWVSGKMFEWDQLR